MFVLFFFFQAEDGIRDTSVTGVQTCALPISRTGTVQGSALRLGNRFVGRPPRVRAAGLRHPEVPHAQARVGRAELGCQERQIGRASVGKEGRSRWSAYE